MKKVLLFLLILLSAAKVQAQVFILNDNLTTGRLSEIRTTVLDSLTNEPVAFASVYVIPSKDTTITNFTITDAKGAAKLEEVPYGSYTFRVEMMGYKPFVRERYFRERRVDMGTIRLQVDEQFLQAATVTAAGNPIVVKKDTVEFNASSFRVGTNAMLKDLLVRMPGMEITEDGKVKFNGEAIDHLTVGGRTFFFDDQSTALNNLPAAVVDKIRVIDRDSQATRATGIQDGKREKVLDVGLKKEYEKGWFGNAGIKGGATLDKAGEDTPLRDKRGLLYNANALVSAYSEKDQITLIGNTQNVSDGNMVFTIVRGDGTRSSSLDQGLSSAAQLGLNANTSRIKDVETTVGANYKYTDTDAATSSARTTYMEGGEMYGVTEDSGKQFANSVSADLELKKEKGKVWFQVGSGFRYNQADTYETGTSQTSRNGATVNSSENAVHSLETSRTAMLSSSVTFRELFGKSGRSLRLMVDGTYGTSEGTSEENSLLRTALHTDSKALNYISDGSALSLNGDIRYTESLGEKWTLSAGAGLGYSGSTQVRDASDAMGHNDYYSSLSRNRYLIQQYDATIQYKFAAQSWLTLGARLSGALNETFSRSYGIEKETGMGEWLWYVTPTLRIRHTVGNNRYNASASGYTNKPSAGSILPVLDIADPSRLGIGNIYLKPYSNTNFSLGWTRNDRERFSTLMLNFFGSLTLNPVSYARWYDSDGILYSLPVNSAKPQLSGNFYASYTTPLNSDKSWSLTLGSSIMYTSSTSYQSKGTLPGLDKETFDYAAFMADFWGADASGSRFYGGQSGFGESRTHTLNPSLDASVKYNQDRYSVSANAAIGGRLSRYSLDPSVNMNTLNTHLGLSGTYTTRHEFDLNSDLTYVFYNGYAEGYGQPEWQWNAEVSKNIGAFNLSIKVNDILNQTRNLTHTVQANYEEDTYRLVMGRYILFGVKWNFGKMNAAHSQRAQQAAWRMVF